MKDNKVYLKYILQCIQKIEEDISCGYKNFMKSHLHQDAVLRNLHTLTESTQRISNEAKAKYPNINWKGISAFRNVLVHDYLGIDLDRVWQVVSEDIPELKKQITQMLTKE